ncbi:porin family protein [Pseudomaricurvus sp. HS19]|uniref:porin family protein n=1 Tax=Pseudomaricurvus sp. HS19 TaxID=2692626 RepID=UPI00136F1C8C|nr:porin family protein [Pseudomaricurvus sp. HS19]MYM63070.1 outer membrane beta-barrel protein [Pseudomaricurvus sp. HS19]
MKATKTVTLGALLSLLTATPALALDSGWYAGASYAQTSYKESGLSELDLSALQAQGGYRLTPHLALETRLGLGVGDDSTRESIYGERVDATAEIDYVVSGFAKAILPLDAVELYVIAGVTYASIEYDVRLVDYGYSASGDDSGSDFSYGAGLAVNPNDNVSVFIEYVNYYDKDEVEIDGYNVGVNFYF